MFDQLLKTNKLRKNANQKNIENDKEAFKDIIKLTKNVSNE